MSQRSKKQKDVDELGKEEQTYATRNEEGGSESFKVSDIRYPDAGADLSRNPETGEPSVSQTITADDSDTKETGTKFENGFVDGPGGRRNTSNPKADAKRDASPDQTPKLVEEDESQDAQQSG
jgi:hypothetical protein